MNMHLVPLMVVKCLVSCHLPNILSMLVILVELAGRSKSCSFLILELVEFDDPRVGSWVNVVPVYQKKFNDIGQIPLEFLMTASVPLLL
jgi:hypothetical protein